MITSVNIGRVYLAQPYVDYLLWGHVYGRFGASPCTLVLGHFGMHDQFLRSWSLQSWITSVRRYIHFGHFFCYRSDLFISKHIACPDSSNNLHTHAVPSVFTTNLRIHYGHRTEPLIQISLLTRSTLRCGHFVPQLCDSRRYYFDITWFNAL